jgi:hypothetical protein
MVQELSIAQLSEIVAEQMVLGASSGSQTILRVTATGELEVVTVDEDGVESAGVLRTDNIEFNAETGGGKVTLNIDSAYAGSQTFEWPTSDGAASQALITDASGNLAFGPALPVPQALDDLTDVEATTPSDGDIIQYNSGSGDWEAIPNPSSPIGKIVLTRFEFTESDAGTTVILSPAADTYLLRVVVRTITGSGGGPKPTIEIGTSTTSDLYMETGDSNLKNSDQIYQVEQYIDLGASPDDIEATIVDLSETFSGEVILWHTVF